MELKNYLVTGANGFVGTALCKELESLNKNVTKLIRADFDLTTDNFAKLNLNNIDCIIHLAAKTHTVSSSIPESKLYDEYYKLNVTASVNLLDAAINNNVKSFIYISSVKAIDNDDIYAKTKLIAENKLRELAKAKINLIILRPALIYGKNVKGNLHSMIKTIKNGYFPPIPKINNKRDLVNINNLIDAIIFFADKELSAPLVIKDKISYSTSDIYLNILTGLNRTKPKFYIPIIVFKIMAKVGDILQCILHRSLPFNSNKYDKLFGNAVYNCNLKAAYNWQPKYTMQDEITSMIAGFN